jgi:hypothetical protein
MYSRQVCKSLTNDLKGVDFAIIKLAKKHGIDVLPDAFKKEK